MWSEQEQKERDIAEAKVQLTKIEAAIILAKNNDLGCEIHIAGIEIGISNNNKILPVLLYEKAEIKKFLTGKPNEWE